MSSLKYFLLALLLAGCCEQRPSSPPPPKSKYGFYPEKNAFFESCDDELPYYKCEVLWSQKDKGGMSGPGLKEFIIGGAAAGAASAVTKGLLK